MPFTIQSGIHFLSVSVFLPYVISSAINKAGNTPLCVTEYVLCVIPLNSLMPLLYLHLLNPHICKSFSNNLTSFSVPKSKLHAVNLLLFRS